MHFELNVNSKLQTEALHGRKCRFNLVFITQTHTTHTHLQLLHLKHFVMAHLLSYFHNGVQNLSFLLKRLLKCVELHH